MIKKVLCLLTALTLAVSAYANMDDNQLAATLVGTWIAPGQVWRFDGNGGWSLRYVSGDEKGAGGNGTWVIRGGVLITHWLDWSNRNITPVEPDNNTPIAFSSHDDLNMSGVMLHRQ